MKSVIKYSFTPNIKITCMNKSLENVEASDGSSQFVSKLEIRHNDKERLVKLLETGGVNGKKQKD